MIAILEELWRILTGEAEYYIQGAEACFRLSWIDVLGTLQTCCGF